MNFVTEYLCRTTMRHLKMEQVVCNKINVWGCRKAIHSKFIAREVQLYLAIFETVRNKIKK